MAPDPHREGSPARRAPAPGEPPGAHPDRDALGLLLASFTGTAVPDWLARALADGLGGVVLFGHNTPDPETCRALAREIHAIAPDAVVALDEEGGDVSRLQAATGSDLPSAWAFGAVDDAALTRRAGRALGDLLAACDVDLDLAPVLDVSTDPANPVIGTRAFGDDPDRVTRHARALAGGLREAGVGACGKHFPGHGATAADSHTALPLVDLDGAALRDHLAPWSLAPWLDAVMTAHVLVPALGEGPASIAAWSRPLLDAVAGPGGFRGLVVTDALDMAAVAAHPGPAEAAVRAVEAGAHLLCLGTAIRRDEQEMLREAHDALVGAVARGRLSRDALAARAAESRERVHALRVRRTGVHAPEVAAALTGLARVGAEAAARSVVARRAELVGPRVAVLDARARPDHAAGPGGGVLARLLAARGYEAFDVHYPDELLAAATAVIVTRLPRADAEEGQALRRALAARPDAIVLHTGVPDAAPEVPRRVLTLGRGRAALSAALDAMQRDDAR